MLPDLQMLIAFTLLLGWLEVRVRSLIASNQAVQDQKNIAMLQAVVRIDMSLDKFVNVASELTKTVSRLEGRFDAMKENH